MLQPHIVFDAKLRVRPNENVEGPEYQVFSHVPPTNIQRFFLGMGNLKKRGDTKWDGREYFDWFAFEIKDRNKVGQPTEIEIYRVYENVKSYEQTWQKDDGRWNSTKQHSADSKGFLAEPDHQVLHPIIQTILDLNAGNAL